RRLVLWHREFALKQENATIEQFGAPISLAYKEGKPTGAAEGFAKKCGVSVDKLSSIQTPKGEVLYFKEEVQGVESKNLLNDMINEFVASLNFGKSMRWGSRTDSFIRPIRTLCVMLGEEVVKAELFGITSNKLAFGHRMVPYTPFSFDFAGEY